MDAVLLGLIVGMSSFLAGAMANQFTGPVTPDTIQKYIDKAHARYEHVIAKARGLPMRRKINIEIQANLSDTEYESLKSALKYSVRTILATTTMIGGDRPKVAMFGSDFFTNNEEIDVYIDENEE